MKNLIKTKISLVLFFTNMSFAATSVNYQNCLETIKKVNTEMTFSRSDFVFNLGEASLGDEKVKTIFVTGKNKNYNAPKKQDDGTYVQELVLGTSKMKIFWNEKKELVKIRSSGVDSFDSEFFSKYIEFDNKNGTCVPTTYYSGSGNTDHKKNQEYFNTLLCHDLEKYLAVNEERKKCITQYGPELMAILEKHQKEITFPKSGHTQETQISMLVFGELTNCKTYKTLELAQNFPLWENATTVSPEILATPVATQKD